jgi:DNA phosphorothioation-dependent restriction protein DptH
LDAEDVNRDSLYAAFDNLHQFEIFEPDTSKTTSLFDLLTGVVVINLSGYDQDIQNLVVAITLDQFYSQMQKSGHSAIRGNLREVSKMILVDEADNFLGQNFSSIRKILKEGREFGVGTILSTQFLNHFSTADNEYSNYILSWIVHRVAEINPREVRALFGLQDNNAVAQMIAGIQGLNKHCSVVNIGRGKPVFIRDRAFWELEG